VISSLGRSSKIARLKNSVLLARRGNRSKVVVRPDKERLNPPALARRPKAIGPRGPTAAVAEINAAAIGPLTPPPSSAPRRNPKNSNRSPKHRKKAKSRCGRSPI
jgi:hypothetical protein